MRRENHKTVSDDKATTQNIFSAENAPLENFEIPEISTAPRAARKNTQPRSLDEIPVSAVELEFELGYI